ncbi:MAG: MerR family transcriptional regulator [Candidatus Pristimantibacillus sp.]
MHKKCYSVDDLSKLTGLTKRTIQYYDNEGVLKAAGRDESNRRFYTENELKMIEQITFYRNLGFSLKQIKGQVIAENTKASLRETLSKQEGYLYSQLENIQGRIDTLAISQNLLDHGYSPPWELLARLIRDINAIDMSTWENYRFSKEQLSAFNHVFDSNQMVLNFYNTFRKLCLKAASYKGANVPAASDLASELAGEWLAMVEQVTEGNSGISDAFLQIDQQREKWNKGERELIEEAETYLEEIIEVHLQK